MMKKALILFLSVIMVLAFTACGGDSSDEESSDTKASVERDLPEGEYKDIGDGTLYLTGSSGSTENGDKIVIYPDKDTSPQAYLGFALWDMDGSVQTYIYIDGVEMDKVQAGAGYEGQIPLDEDTPWALTEGGHEVEAVQYDNNDTSKAMTFFRAEKYTVKGE